MILLKLGLLILENELWDDHFVFLWNLVHVGYMAKMHVHHCHDPLCLKRGILGILLGLNCRMVKGLCQGDKPGCMCVYVAPPILVGVWLMALVLR